MNREVTKLNLTLGGIKDMDGLPQAAFVIDPKREEIAVQECRKLGIPVIGVVDTNCDPDLIDYIIPGNDDAIRAIKLFAASIAEACMEGDAMHKERGLAEKAAKAAPKAAEKPEEEAPATTATSEEDA
jgi:small subunit ribosomal protein S2